LFFSDKKEERKEKKEKKFVVCLLFQSFVQLSNFFILHKRERERKNEMMRE